MKGLVTLCDVQHNCNILYIITEQCSKRHQYMKQPLKPAKLSTRAKIFNPGTTPWDDCNNYVVCLCREVSLQLFSRVLLCPKDPAKPRVLLLLTLVPIRSVVV